MSSHRRHTKQTWKCAECDIRWPCAGVLAVRGELRRAEYEAARLDPTTDRDRWDAWDDGGLEAPGEDEF